MTCGPYRFDPICQSQVESRLRMGPRGRARAILGLTLMTSAAARAQGKHVIARTSKKSRQHAADTRPVAAMADADRVDADAAY
jgi:hypothetical protein